MTLKDLEPLDHIEMIMVKRLGNEEDAVSAILNRRAYLRSNSEYVSSLCQDQVRGRYAPRNEKETATMPILYEEDV